jgi:hypothetical protein
MKPLSYLLIHYKRDESYNVVFLIHYNVRRIFLFDTIYILLLETNFGALFNTFRRDDFPLPLFLRYLLPIGPSLSFIYGLSQNIESSKKKKPHNELPLENLTMPPHPSMAPHPRYVLNLMFYTCEPSPRRA